LVVIAFLYLLLVFLFPVTIYLLVLGVIHRRRCPLLVAGTWDFAGVLFAASGFLLVGGPVILTVLNERWRIGFFLGGQQAGDGDESWHVWMLVWGVYFLVVAVGGGVLIWLRRNTTSIYNAEPLVVERTLAQVLEGLGKKWVRSGQRFYLAGPAELAEPDPDTPTGMTQNPHSFPPARELQYAPADLDEEDLPAALAQAPMVEVDPFLLMYHVGLTWHNTSRSLRRQVETELERALDRMPTAENPVGGWLLSFAGFLFCLMIGILLLLLTIHLGRGR
jgi:hypothetical protein